MAGIWVGRGQASWRYEGLPVVAVLDHAEPEGVVTMSASGIVLSVRSIEAVQKVITGDIPRHCEKAVAPRRSGPEIIRFFNDFGFNDSYSMGGGMPSRWAMAESKLKDLNGDPKLARVIREALAPTHFAGSEFSIEAAVEYLRPFLREDGIELVLSGGRYLVGSDAARTVMVEKSGSAVKDINHAFIDDQLQKCDVKVAAGDYTGAITNARSLVEAVLREMERRLTKNPEDYSGDLPALYKRVRILLNLDPKGGETQPFHLVLMGLTNIVAGIAPMRNSMSDAHPLEYQPAKHHARLATNSAKTVTDFIFSTYEYQLAKGTISPPK